MDTSPIFFYHGSCGQCHHLHCEYQLQLPESNDIYSTYRCEFCKCKMFGIGRSLPRISLVSVNTLLVGEEAPAVEAATLPEGIVPGATDSTSDEALDGHSDPSVDQPTVNYGDTSQARSLVPSSHTRVSGEVPASPENGSVQQCPDPAENQSPTHSPFQGLTIKLVAKKHKIIAQIRRHIPGIPWRQPKKILNGHQPQTTVPVMNDPAPLKNVGTKTDTIIQSDTEEPTDTNQRQHTANVGPDESQVRSPDLAQLLAPSMAITAQAQEALTKRKEEIRLLRGRRTAQKDIEQSLCSCQDGCHCRTNYNPRTGSNSSMSLSANSQNLGDLRSTRTNTSSSLSLLPLPPQARALAYTGGQFGDVNAVHHDRVATQEEDDGRRLSHISITSGTTAVNSNSSGRGGHRHRTQRENSLPLLTSRNIDRIIELFNIDRNRPETQHAIRILTAATTSYTDSEPGISRTSSIDVNSPRQSWVFESVTHLYNRPHPSRLTLSDVSEPPATHTTIAAAPNGTPTEEQDNSSRVTPQPSNSAIRSPTMGQAISDLLPNGSENST